MRVVTRRQWGARPPRHVTDLPNVDTIVYHYSAAGSDETSHENCASRVRGIQRFHMDTRGWNDIAYNFLVCRHGYVFEGRGFAYRSAATGDDNDHTLAVCFLGDDDPGDDVTNAGRQAFVDIAQAIEADRDKRMLYRGHRDFMSTACPGDEIYGYVRSRSFAEAVDDAGPLPGPSPKPRWFWEAADAWLAGQRTNLPGPSPKPQWFWDAVEAWVERH